MKEEFNKDMENFREKNQTEIMEIKSSINQINNTVEGLSSRLEQVEDRISWLKDKIDIKEKMEVLDKRSRAAKGTHKDSVTPSKDRTCESWTSKKKQCNPKVYIIYSTK
jgi:peptidoglycan hydrolase CwlO-like protein